LRVRVPSAPPQAPDFIHTFLPLFGRGSTLAENAMEARRSKREASGAFLSVCTISGSACLDAR